MLCVWGGGGGCVEKKGSFVTMMSLFWPEPMTLQTKLWGTWDDLPRMANFAERHS
jgi:hypothetical protein